MNTPAFLRAYIILGSVLLIHACGGGGGGGGGSSSTGRSFNDLSTDFTKRQQQAYTGSTAQATLTKDNLVTFARLYLSDTLPIESEAINSQANDREKSRQSTTLKRLLNKASKQRDANQSDARERFDDRSDCSNEGGYITAQGEISDDGQSYKGGLDIQYHHCQMAANSFYDGSAIFFIGDDAQGGAYFYDGLEITIGDTKRIVTGAIVTRNDGHVITNLTVKDQATSLTFQFVDLDRYNNEYDSYVSNQGASGRIYHPTFGYVQVGGNYGINLGTADPSGTGTLSLTGAGNQAVAFTFQNRVARVEMNSDEAAYVSLGTLLINGKYSAPQFMPNDILGQPPGYGYLAFTKDVYTYTTVDDIEVELADAQDPDGDEISIRYRWSINDKIIAGQTANRLPAGLTHKNDNIRVTAILSDGKSVIDVPSPSFIINDAPPMVIVSDAPSEAQVGESVSFSAVYADPDGESVPATPTTMVYGPAGATFDANGSVSWTPERNLFGQEQIFHFGFRDNAGTTETVDVAITVRDEAGALPLVKSDLGSSTYDTEVKSVHIAQLDDDAQQEILMTNSKALFAMEKHDDRIEQEWVYPYRLSERGAIVGAIGKDLDNDGIAEIIAATADGVFIIENQHTLASRIYTAENYQLVDFAVEDIDNDGAFEAVLLTQTTSPYYYSNGENTIEVIDLESGTLSMKISIPGENRRIAVNNVDNDSALEFIADGGYVYDSKSGSNEWVYSDGFGGNFTTADVDGNGIAEIIASDSDGYLNILNAVAKSSRSTTIQYASAMTATNVDNDAATEIIIKQSPYYGDGYIEVIDASANEPVVQWTKSAGYSYSNTPPALVVGDLDNDGARDLIITNNYYVPISIHGFSANDNANSTIYPSSFYNLTPVGYAQIQPGVNLAAFLGSSGLMTLSAAGDINVIAKDLSANSSNVTGTTTDFNQDGYGELFATNMTGSIFSAIRLNDLASVGSLSGSNNRYNARKVIAEDLNGDSFQEAIVADSSNKIIAFDIANQTILWTGPTVSYNAYDLATGQLDNDLNKEIVLATGTELTIWKKSGTTYTNHKKLSTTCDRIGIADVTGDNAREIVCAMTNFYDPDTIIFYDSELNEISKITLNGTLTDFNVLHAATGKQALIVALTGYVSDAYNMGHERHYIAEVSAETGAVVWESPSLLGQVSSNSLRPFVDENGKQQLMFTTSNAVYLTR